MVIATTNIFTICDGASVRDGLLSVLSGGINKLTRPEYPAEFGGWIAIQVVIETFKAGDSVLLEVKTTNADGSPCAIPDFHGEPDEIPAEAEDAPFTIPLILDARSLPIEDAGRYRMALMLNGEEIGRLQFQAVLAESLEGVLVPS